MGNEQRETRAKTKANTTTSSNPKAPTARDKGKGKVTGDSSKQTGKRAKTDAGRSKKKLHLQDDAQTQASQQYAEQGEVEYTAKQIADYKHFRAITICPTRLISRAFLVRTGLETDVRNMLNEMGLRKLSELHDFVYPELVQEFFATIEFSYKRREQKPEEGTMKFVSFGREYSLTIPELCEIYGFHNGRDVRFEEFESADIFWDTIADGDAQGNPKASLIRNPAIRYVHRFLANTLFARKQSGGVRREELCLLFKGLRKFLADDDGPMFSDEKEDDINLGCIFARELSRMRAWGRKTTEPQCYMGSLLTPIFRKIGLDLTCHFANTERGRLNREYFVSCRIIYDSEEAGDYPYIYTTRQHTQRVLQLPNPTLTSIDSIQNILFEYEGETIGPRRQEQRQQAVQPEEAQPEHEDLPELPLQTQSDPWELPELPFQPKTAREKFLVNAYNLQKKINKMAKKKFNWLKSKLKKMPGYVSDEAEFEDNEEAPREQPQGPPEAAARSSYHGGSEGQESFDEAHQDYHHRFSYQGDHGTDHYFPTTSNPGGFGPSYH